MLKRKVFSYIALLIVLACNNNNERISNRIFLENINEVNDGSKRIDKSFIDPILAQNNFVYQSLDGNCVNCIIKAIQFVNQAHQIHDRFAEVTFFICITANTSFDFLSMVDQIKTDANFIYYIWIESFRMKFFEEGKIYYKYEENIKVIKSAIDILAISEEHTRYK